jgi:hypothetical protein
MRCHAMLSPAILRYPMLSFAIDPVLCYPLLSYPISYPISYISYLIYPSIYPSTHKYTHLYSQSISILDSAAGSKGPGRRQRAGRQTECLLVRKPPRGGWAWNPSQIRIFQCEIHRAKWETFWNFGFSMLGYWEIDGGNYCFTWFYMLFLGGSKCRHMEETFPDCWPFWKNILRGQEPQTVRGVGSQCRKAVVCQRF